MKPNDGSNTENYKTLLIPQLPHNFLTAVLTTTWRLIFTEIKLEGKIYRKDVQSNLYKKSKH